MASLSPYTFNNTGRIGADSTDQSQRNTTITHYANYMLTDHFSSTLSDNHVKFAMQQPTMNFNGLADLSSDINKFDFNSEIQYLDLKERRWLASFI